MWPFKKTPTRGKRAFQGAMIDRLTADWVAMGSSQDAEIRASLPRLRNRSRDLCRNNDYVKGFIREVQNNVIGEGIPFQAQVRMKRGGGRLDEKTNAIIEALWAEWTRAENCDTSGKMCFEEIERLVTRAVFESGEVIIRKVYQNMGGMKTRLALEVVESDLLDDNYNAISERGNAIRMGVEVNQWGRPVGYWFLHRHPGDYGVMPNAPEEPGRRIFIPADEIIHLFISERPRQTRGIPAISSAITRLRHMQGYEEGEVIRKRANASIMGFIESPEEELSIEDAVDSGQSVTEFEPGVFKKLAPGEKVSVPSLGGNDALLDPFMRLMLRGVSAGGGISYEALSKDYSNTNYSSARQALLSDRDNWRVLQKWVIRHFHQRIVEAWFDMAVLSGDLMLQDYELNSRSYQAVKWQPRGWTWIDPLKEVQAYKEAVRSGFMTQSEVIGQSGGDVEELMTNRQRELEMAKEKGLIFDTDPSQVASTGVQQPSEAGSAGASSGGTAKEPAATSS